MCTILYDSGGGGGIGDHLYHLFTSIIYLHFLLILGKNNYIFQIKHVMALQALDANFLRTGG